MSKLSRQLMRSLTWTAKNLKEKRTGKRDWGFQFQELWWAAQDTLIYSWWQPITIWWESLCRIVGWLPILWKDRDWVDNYIFMILAYRLKRARISMDKYSYYANSDKYCKQMRVAELLLQRLQDSHNYVDTDWSEHTKKWPSTNCCIENKDGTYSLLPHSDQESKEVKRLMDKEEYMWQQDFNYLMKHMRKYVRNWGH